MMTERFLWWLAFMGGLSLFFAFITWHAERVNGLLGWPEYPRNVQPPITQRKDEQR